MAHDESRHQGDEHSQTGEPPDEALAPMTIDTADPIIDTAVEHPSDWKLHPDATTRVETNSVGELDLPRVSGVRTVVDEPRPAHGEDRGHDQEDRGQDRPRREPQQQRSMIIQLLITASVALVCGVIGAMGYAHFVDLKSKGPSSDQSQVKGDSGSNKESGSNEKSDGGKSQDSAKASTADSIPGDLAGKDAQMVTQQIKDLSQRVDQLRERVDNATRPADETAPALRMIQIKMSELAHEKAEVSALAAAHRRFDNRLETLKEELNTLRVRIEAAQADSTVGRIPGPPVLSATPTARKD